MFWTHGNCCGKTWNLTFWNFQKLLVNGRKKLMNLKQNGIFQIAWDLLMANTAISLHPQNLDHHGFVTRNISQWFWWLLLMHSVGSHGSMLVHVEVRMTQQYFSSQHLEPELWKENYLCHPQGKSIQILMQKSHTCWLVMRPSLAKLIWWNHTLGQERMIYLKGNEFSTTDWAELVALLKVHLDCWRHDSGSWSMWLKCNWKLTKKCWKQQLSFTIT